jgi:hypothetical protein
MAKAPSITKFTIVFGSIDRGRSNPIHREAPGNDGLVGRAPGRALLSPGGVRITHGSCFPRDRTQIRSAARPIGFGLSEPIDPGRPTPPGRSKARRRKREFGANEANRPRAGKIVRNQDLRRDKRRFTWTIEPKFDAKSTRAASRPARLRPAEIRGGSGDEAGLDFGANEAVFGEGPGRSDDTCLVSRSPARDLLRRAGCGEALFQSSETMSKRRVLLLIGAFVLLAAAVGLEVAAWKSRDSSAVVMVVNEGDTTIEGLVVGFGEVRHALGDVPSGQSARAWLEGSGAGTVSLSFTQAGNPMTGFLVEDVDVGMMNAEDLKLVLRIQNNQVTRNIEDGDATPSPLGGLWQRFVDRLSAELSLGY